MNITCGLLYSHYYPRCTHLRSMYMPDCCSSVAAVANALQRVNILFSIELNCNVCSLRVWAQWICSVVGSSQRRRIEMKKNSLNDFSPRSFVCVCIQVLFMCGTSLSIACTLGTMTDREKKRIVWILGNNTHYAATASTTVTADADCRECIQLITI